MQLFLAQRSSETDDSITITTAIAIDVDNPITNFFNFALSMVPVSGPIAKYSQLK